MKGRKERFAATAAGLLILVLIAPTAAAASGPPARVFLCTDRLKVHAGDLVNLTLYTLRAGTLADGNGISVVWELNGSQWLVPVTQVATGTYSGSFRVNVTNPGPTSQGLLVYAQVSFPEGASAHAELYMELLPARSLEVQLEPSSYQLKPGDNLVIGIHILEAGQLLDATNLSARVMPVGWELTASSTELTWTRTGAGAYEARYTIPADQYEPWLLLTVEAWAGNATGVGVRALSVLQSHPFGIWIHAGEGGSDFLRFEIFVAREAAPESGAVVEVAYTTMGSYPGTPDTGRMIATTDARGRASFNLSHSPGFGMALILGNVTQGSARQGFSTTVRPAAPLSPGLPAPFDVRRSDPWGLVTPNETATLRYRALQQGKPLSRASIEYYVSSPFSLLAFGTTQTDDNGSFSLRAPITPTAISIGFSANVSGQWESSDDLLVPEYPLAVTATPLRPGAVSRGTGTAPAGSGPWELTTSLVPLDASGTWPDSIWQPATIGISLPDELVLQSPFPVNQSFPSFLPKGRDYVRSIVLMPASHAETAYSRWRPEWEFREVLSIPNVRPEPRFSLSTPEPAAGEAVRLDASQSSDVDGWVDAFQIDWGDGEWTNWVAEATFEHAYRVGRDFLITLHVRDDSGAYNTTSLGIRVAPAILGVRLAVLLPIAGMLAALGAVGAGWFVHRQRARAAARSRISGEPRIAPGSERQPLPPAEDRRPPPSP